jgi:hypothetical protein
LERTQAQRVIELVWKIERLDNVGDLARLLAVQRQE